MKLNFWPFNRACQVQPAILPIETESKKPARTFKAWDHEGIIAAKAAGLQADDEARKQFTPYRLPSVPPNMKPQADVVMAMDNGACNPVARNNSVYAWANQFSSMFEEGQLFMGYPTIAAYLQRSEYRIPSEAIAEETTRNWGEVTYSGEDTDQSSKQKAAEKRKEIDDELKRLKVKDLVQAHIYNAEAFGRSQIYIDAGRATDSPEELRKPLVLDKVKIGKDGLKNLQLIEPMWTYPGVYNTIDPLKPDYYKPQTWFVLGKEVHHTRMLTTVPHPVSQILMPAYAFGGLSMTQMMKPYVDNWLQTRQSVNDIIQNFSTSVLKTDMGTLTQSDEAIRRAQLFVLNRSNQGVFMVDKEGEDFANVSTPLSSLDKLQAQAQEHMAAPARMPLVKLLGITPTGLNASTEGEMQAYRETTSSYQEKNLSPILEAIIKLAQLNLWGDIDPNIGWKWNPIKHLDRVEEATAEKAEAETDSIRINDGVISPEEVRTKLANDENGQYHGIDPNDVPDPLEQKQDLGVGAPFTKQEKA